MKVEYQLYYFRQITGKNIMRTLNCTKNLESPNNYGYSPSWYFRQIVVMNRATAGTDVCLFVTGKYHDTNLYIYIVLTSVTSQCTCRPRAAGVGNLATRLPVRLMSNSVKTMQYQTILFFNHTVNQ